MKKSELKQMIKAVMIQEGFFDRFKKKSKNNSLHDAPLKVSDNILKKYGNEFTNLGYDEDGVLIGNHIKSKRNGVDVIDFLKHHGK